MNRKISLFLVGILSLASSSASTAGLDFLSLKTYEYHVRLSRAASYQFSPGDYMELIVTSGLPRHRVQKTVAKKVQVMGITELKTDVVEVCLTLNKRQWVSLHRALAESEPQVAMHLVQKEPRAAVAVPAQDDLPDLEFENKTDLAETHPKI